MQVFVLVNTAFVFCIVVIFFPGQFFCITGNFFILDYLQEHNIKIVLSKAKLAHPRQTSMAAPSFIHKIITFSPIN